MFGIGQAPELGKDRPIYEEQIEGFKKRFKHRVKRQNPTRTK